ncbi:MAG TPA: RHS repeat-associated core domain-containing protein [Mycobacteriales bacterium]|nr:RHS repeat-associated core domain-containing protein [Mycobacteriales bacterium]
MSRRRSVLSARRWSLAVFPTVVATSAGLMLVAPAQVASATSTTSNGNANVQLSSAVGSITAKPVLGLQLTANRTDAIPGDVITYTAKVTNTGVDLELGGTMTARSSGSTDATVASWYEQVQYRNPANKWIPVAGYATSRPGYSPQDPGAGSPAALTLTVTPNAASGVTYPTDPGTDNVLGTDISPKATASWAVSGGTLVPPSVVAALANAKKAKAIRVVVHLEVTPRNSNAAQPATDTQSPSNPLQGGTAATVTNVSVAFDLPSGSVTVDKSVAPALGSLATGASATAKTTYEVPVPGVRPDSQTESDYLNGLEALVGHQIVVSADAEGASAGSPGSPGGDPGHHYGGGDVNGDLHSGHGDKGALPPTPPGVAASGEQQVSTLEHLPVVTVAKTGPATADAGSTVHYSLKVTNNGDSRAASIGLADSLPAGPLDVSGVPAAVNPASSATASASYTIPTSSENGPLTDTAEVTWTDNNGNKYGPMSGMVTTTVRSGFAGATLTLSPSAAGPDVVGTHQALTATLLAKDGTPISGQDITVTVTGPNATTLSGTTNGSGVAVVGYDGSSPGTDTAQANFGDGDNPIMSATSMIGWTKPIEPVSIGTVSGNFYRVSNVSTFTATKSSTPVFSQQFPDIAFNPPSGAVPHNITGVGPATQPFTDVTLDAVGNGAGTIPAQGNGAHAFSSDMPAFDAVLNSSFTVAQAGDVTFQLTYRSGFLLGVGNGATRVNGIFEHIPASGASPFNGYPLVAGNDAANSLRSDTFTIHFPSAGTYPFELDYFTCCATSPGSSLVLSSVSFTADTSPLSIYLGYADGLRPGGSVFPFPWQGSPGVNFVGESATNYTYDDGAIRFDNTSDSPITLDDVSVDIGRTHLDIWPKSKLVVPANGIMILTGTNGDNFDTSDYPTITCSKDGLIPQIHVTQDGQTTTYADTSQILNTGGFDLACFGNESHPWVRLGGSPVGVATPLPPSATLLLSPEKARTANVGDTLKYTVSALDADGQAMPDVPVDLAISGASTPGTAAAKHLLGTTDATGGVTFSYAGTNPGTDTIQATAFITGMRTFSNAGTVTWSIPPFTPPTSTPTPTPTTTTPTPTSTPSPTATATPTPTPTATGTSTATASPSPTATSSPSPTATSTSSPSPSSSASPTPTPSSTPTITPTPTPTQSSPPGAPPSIVITAPTDGSKVTAPSAVKATITPPTGQTITSWQVTQRNLAGGIASTIGSGTGTPPATLATFDPTTLPNGNYQIQVSATASTNGSNAVSETVIVDGQLKPGRYVADYQDLTVPVTGFNMTVDRHYDSIDRGSGDFGPGWSLSLSSVRIAANRVLGDGGWVQYDVSCTFGICTTGFRTTTPHTVTVTYPDGHQDLFDFTPRGESGEDDFADAAFTARAGTTSSLVALGDTQMIYQGDGDLYDEDNGEPYNPTQFQLTTHDGRVFVLDVNTGLVSVTDTNGNKLSVTSNGVTSTSGSALTFTRDSSHRITKITSSDGRSVSYGYNGSGDLTTYTDPDANVSHYTYDGAHHMLSQNGDAPARTMTYGPDGRLTGITDGDGNTATLSIDPSLRSETLSDPSGKLTTILSFDALGDIVQEDDVAGGSDRTTKHAYDAQGRLLTTVNGLGKTTVTNTYDSSGDLTSAKDGLGRITRYTYDAAGHVLTKTLPSGAVQQTNTYNDQGGLTAMKLANGATYHYGYDSAGRPTSFSDPLNRTGSVTYDSLGHPSSTTDAAGDTMHIQTAANGEVSSTTDPLGGVTSYSYDSRGDVLSTTNALGQVFGYTYDSLGNVLSTTDPLGHTTHLDRNGNGLLTTSTDRDGDMVTYGYDTDGRLASVTLPDGSTTTYAYDGFGDMTKAVNATETLGFDYNDAGQEVSTTAAPTSNSDPEPTVTLTYAYDDAGELTGVDGPAGTVGYAYNADSLLDQVTDPSGGRFSITSDATGRRTALTRPNGVDDTISYNAADDVTAIDSTDGAGATADFNHYTYTPAGQRASFTNGDGTATYGYDANGQLVSAAYPTASGLASESFSYDDIGDRQDASQAYDAAGRLTSDGTYTYTYDDEGNLTSRTDTSSHQVSHYTWNAEHQLVGVTAADGTQTAFGYDPLGRRVDVTSSSGRVHTVYDGQNAIATYDGTGALTASFVHGATGDEQLEEAVGGAAYYYLHDALGSVTALTDSSGAVVDRYRYTAFGAVHGTGSVPNPFTYIDATTDRSTGLVYLNARYLDPGLGRFISEDPVPGDALYPYALDDPTDLSDPSGQTTLAEQDAAEDIEGQLDSYSNQQYLRLITKAAQLISTAFLVFELDYETAIHAPQLGDTASAAGQWILSHPAASGMILSGIATTIGGAGFAVWAGKKFFGTISDLTKAGEVFEAAELWLKAGVILATIGGIGAGGLGLIWGGVCDAIGQAHLPDRLGGNVCPS